MQHKPSIYIVEDQGLTRLALVKVLQNNGYYILGTASTAEKAWLDLQDKKPDLVLLDFNLKGIKNGLWLAEKINSSSKIPVVFLTAYGSQDFLNKLFTVKIAGYVMKPFNNPTLLSAIKIALQVHTAQNDVQLHGGGVFLKTKAGILKFSAEDIQFLQSQKNNVLIQCVDGQHEVRDKLEIILQKLNSTLLYRIHRRFAVNIQFVSKIEKNSSFVGGVEIPMTKTYQTLEFLERCQLKNSDL